MTVVLGSAVERVRLGVAAAAAVAEEAENLGAQRIFLLVSRHLDENTSEIEKIRAALGRRHAATHCGIRPHVPKGDLRLAARHAREVGADLVIAVGGGSVIDAAKLVALCLSRTVETPEDLATICRNIAGEGATAISAEPPVRAICVPTTLSAGEFSPLAGATDEMVGRKEAFSHRLLTPVCVILDPALTLHTPEWLWLSTGVRAVDHAVETLASLLSNEFADGLAESGLRLLAAGLPATKARPDDLDARLRCQIGAWQSILPIVANVPMGASHAIGHILGAMFNVPHGYTSCVMAPFVQAWNEPAIEHRQRRISACFDAGGVSIWEVLDSFIRALEMPRTLAEIGIKAEQLDRIAASAIDDIWGRTNPRQISGSADMLEILSLAFKGGIDRAFQPEDRATIQRRCLRQ